MKNSVTAFDLRFIAFLRRYQLLIARIAIFIVYTWFGLLKLLGQSPASPIAETLVSKTVGAAYFDTLFVILAVFECVIGVLFLFPKAIRVVFPMLLLHLLIVCSPLLLVPAQVWASAFVPTLEGQYIIKNVLIVALAVAIAANTKPSGKKR